jgi:hypothetical protein
MKTAILILKFMLAAIVSIISLVTGFYFPATIDMGIWGTVLFPTALVGISLICFTLAVITAKKLTD